jgi:hypothetical protein
MEIDYPAKDFGFSSAPREQLTEAVLDGGPLSAQRMKIEAIAELKFDDGFYKLDPAITPTPPDGSRYAYFRWISENKLQDRNY